MSQNTLLSCLAIKRAPPRLHHAEAKYETPLLIRAISHGSLEVARAVIESSDVDMNSQDSKGRTALHNAANLPLTNSTGCRLVEKLLANGALVDVRDATGLTPLFLAVSQNNVRTARLLLTEGKANPQIFRISDKWTPLHVAASSGVTEMTSLLLSNGAPSRPRGLLGETPMDVAKNKGNLDVLEVLEAFERIPGRMAFKTREFLHENLMDRLTARQLLMRSGSMTNGSFLVRQSWTKLGVHVLVVVHEGRMYNYAVEKVDEQFYLDEGPLFASLEHLVEHYRRSSYGLPCPLQRPVRPLNGIEFVSPVDLEISGHSLGVGQFATVRRGTWTQSNRRAVPVAVKQHKKDIATNLNSQDLEKLYAEVVAMAELKSDHIVKLIGICLEESPMSLVMELMAGGSLKDRLQARDVSSANVRKWALDIAQGMSFLESKGYVHRDLAARNVLLTADETAKIGDFGFSRCIANMDHYRSTYTGRCPLKWYAPESLVSMVFTHKSDVWSFGVTIWEMLTRGKKLPYKGKNSSKLVAYVRAGGRLDIEPNWPEDLKVLLMSCWAHEPMERPTFAHLVYFFRA